MKLKDIGKRFTALLVCCLICIVTAAAVNYSPWTGTVTGKNNIKYHGRTSISSSRGLVTSTASIVTTDSTKVPAGYVEATAELYYNNFSTVAAFGGPVQNETLSTGVTATTGPASGRGVYYAEGTTRYKGTDDKLKTLELESTSLSMSARSDNGENEFTDEEARSVYNVKGVTSEELLLLCQDEEFLSEIDGTNIDGIWFSSEDMQICTNENGNTYGSAGFVKHAKLDVDLISALGKNGTIGYIWRSSLPYNIPNYVPYDHEIPVYASDGVTVVDSFFISSGSGNANTGATE